MKIWLTVPLSCVDNFASTLELPEPRPVPTSSGPLASVKFQSLSVSDPKFVIRHHKRELAFLIEHYCLLYPGSVSSYLKQCMCRPAHFFNMCFYYCRFIHSTTICYRREGVRSQPHSVKGGGATSWNRLQTTGLVYLFEVIGSGMGCLWHVISLCTEWCNFSDPCVKICQKIVKCGVTNNHCFVYDKTAFSKDLQLWRKQ